MKFKDLVKSTATRALYSAGSRVVDRATAALNGVIGAATGTGALVNPVTESVELPVFSAESTPSVINPNYMVQVVQSETGVDILAYLPSEIQIDVTSDYDAPFAEGFVDNPKVNTYLQMAGFVPTTQAMSTQFWKGSSPIELTLPLVFVVETDPVKDLLQPIQQLMSLAMPRRRNGVNGEKSVFLTPPGPKLTVDENFARKALDMGKAAITDSDFSSIEAGAASTQKTIGELSDMIKFTEKISLRVGSFLMLDSVVVRSVSQTYKTLLSPDGQPMQATVNVTFTTHQTPIFDDIPRMFPGMRGVMNK